MLEPHTYRVYFGGAAGEFDSFLQSFHAIVVAECYEGVGSCLAHKFQGSVGLHLIERDGGGE